MKRLFAVLLAIAMVMMIGSVYAAELKITNATLGQDYFAYKIFGANVADPTDLGKGISYLATDTQIAIAGFTDIFDVATADGVNIISVKSDVADHDVVAFIKDNYNALKQGDAINGTYSDNSTYVFSGLADGYYYVTSSLGSLVTIDSAGESVEIVDKNESEPEKPEKGIVSEDACIADELDKTFETAVKENHASVGADETFKVTFNATNWVQEKDSDEPNIEPGTKTQVTEYNFKDTPVGLEIKADTVKVTVNGTDITSTITDKTVDSNGVLSFTIPWVDENGKSLYATPSSGSALIPVVITYDATVTDDAATKEASNTIEVLYNGDTSLGTDETTTLTYKFQVEKVDDKKAALLGAEFELYYGDGSGDPLTFTQVGEDAVYRYDPDGTVTHIVPAGENATALIIGLDDAIYVLKEVVVPDGYNKAADQPVSGLSNVTVADAEATKVDVINKMGSELPSTGGSGTTIFYVIGGLLIIGAAVVLVARRKAQE